MMLLASHASYSAEIEVPGLVTDNTITRVGHDFYRAFTDHWEEEYPGSITINERPSARWGSWITIKVDQDLLYQTFLFPSKNDFNKQIDNAFLTLPVDFTAAVKVAGNVIIDLHARRFSLGKIIDAFGQCLA